MSKEMLKNLIDLVLDKESKRTCYRMARTKSTRTFADVGKSKFTQIAAIISGFLPHMEVLE